MDKQKIIYDVSQKADVVTDLAVLRRSLWTYAAIAEALGHQALRLVPEAGNGEAWPELYSKIMEAHALAKGLFEHYKTVLVNKPVGF